MKSEMRKVIKKIFVLAAVLWLPAAAHAFSLSEAHKDYLSGNYEEALYKAETLPKNGQTLYFLGLVHVKTGEYDKARLYLRKVIKRYPDSGICQKSMVKLADTYFLKEDYGNAAELYNEIRRRYPSLDNMPVVLLRLAQIAGRQGKWDEKNKYVRLIRDKYPRASEIKFVKVLEGYGDSFTVQVGAFSKRENALSLKEELNEQYDTYVSEDEKNGYSIYKVRIGKFKKRYDAEKAAKTLLNEGYPVRIYP